MYMKVSLSVFFFFFFLNVEVEVCSIWVLSNSLKVTVDRLSPCLRHGFLRSEENVHTSGSLVEGMEKVRPQST